MSSCFHMIAIMCRHVNNHNNHHSTWISLIFNLTFDMYFVAIMIVCWVMLDHRHSLPPWTIARSHTLCLQCFWYVTIVTDNNNIAIMISWQIVLDYDWHIHIYIHFVGSLSAISWLQSHVAFTTIINNVSHMHLIAIMVVCWIMYDHRHLHPPWTIPWSHTRYLQSWY